MVDYHCIKCHKGKTQPEYTQILGSLKRKQENFFKKKK